MRMSVKVRGFSMGCRGSFNRTRGGAQQKRLESSGITRTGLPPRRVVLGSLIFYFPIFSKSSNCHVFLQVIAGLPSPSNSKGSQT